MSPLIKKEIRLLLPAWIGAMLLAIVPAWIAGSTLILNYSINANRAQSDFWLEGLAPMIFALGILLLGLSSFGQEFSQGTFTVLLAQPMERSRIWRTKISILAFAFLTVWLAAVVSIACQYYLYDSLHPYPTFQRFSYAFDRAAVLLTLSVLVAFSGGLWTTLLLRQVTNAFWFSLLTPLAIIFGTMSLLSDRIASDEGVTIFIIVALAIYSVAGFFAAAILFRRCQDLQWTGGEVSLPKFKKISGTASIPFRLRSRFSALCWKEIQLHQVNILIASLILVLHLFSFTVRKIHPHFGNPDIEFVLEAFWLLWMLMPVLIGCSAIADERRLGIVESQLSLPVSRRAQLLVKFSVGLLLSLLLGAAIPLLVERTKDLSYWLFLIVAALFFVSFYASSLSRTVLQAIGLAMVVGVALFFGETISVINALINLLQHRYPGYSEPGLDLLKTFLGLPILLSVLIYLIFWNYKQLRQNTSLLLINFSSLMAAFAVIYLLIFGIYFRAWEYVTPTLPLRGFMRLSPATEVKLAGSPGAIYAVLPDGRLWTQTRPYRVFPNGFAIPIKGQSAFVPGSNWVEVAADNFQGIGIRADGSLWSIRKPWGVSHDWISQKGPFTLAQIGSATDWSQVAGSSIGFLLLKNNGSLWIWGTNGFDWQHFQSSVPLKLKSDLAQPPARFGGKIDWMQLYSSDASAYAMNNHGDVWRWLSWVGTNNVSQFYIDATTKDEWSCFSPRSDGFYLGITTNGELWLKTTRPYLLAEGTKWKAAAFANWNDMLAIRNDGTLWNCTDYAPVQLDTHSDWIALSPGGLVLAADGGLWAWNQPNPYPWLAPSHKPVYMGNIFEGTPASPAAP